MPLETRGDRILTRAQPILKVQRRHPKGSSFVLPPNDNVSRLPKSFLRTFREFNHATREWVDTAKPCIFSDLHVSFPFDYYLPEKLNALERITPHCQQLEVSLLTFLRPPSTTLVAPPLPPFPLLPDLRLNCPRFSAFYPLSCLRQALESTSLPLLTNLTISGLTLNGIAALRWGVLTSFGSSNSTSRQLWQRLKYLDINFVPWFGKATEKRKDYLKTDDSPEAYEDWRTGIRLLHDWLNSFACTGRLETLNFRWQGGVGPNPLLLDLIAETVCKGRWFTGPGINWQGLEEIQLMGVRVTEKDVKLIQERVPNLRSWRAQPDLVGHDVFEVPEAQDNARDRRQSVLIRLEESPARPAGETTTTVLKGLEDAVDDLLVAPELLRHWDPDIDTDSIDVPFVLDESAAEDW